MPESPIGQRSILAVDDSGCRASSTEPIVDIDYCYAACTAVEHGQHGGDPLQIGTVTDTGGQRNDRSFDQAGHHTG